MSKPRELHLGDWNNMVHAFHAESHRGAAVLAGGFVEHVLGFYLRAMSAVPSAAEELFSPLGPLSSFSQRITVGYAFGLFRESYYHDLTCIRRIRNHFAHHPPGYHVHHEGGG
jgi:DNA-binding MltR family transcriptional regulator